MKALILASQSPRRKQLLSEAGFNFKVQAVPTTETFPGNLDVRKAPEFIAKGKAMALWNTFSPAEKENNIILAADTVVILENKILGKPADSSVAIDYLKLLSGKVHEVITGVYLLANGQNCSFATSTKVYFRKLTEAQIRYYVEAFKPFDKAGAYAIQEWIGLIGIEKIEGDYYNVVGLPIGAVTAALAARFSIENGK